MSDARPPRPPPPRASDLAVAEAALNLGEWVDPECSILVFLRTAPRVGAILRELEAKRDYTRLRQGGLGSVEARRLVAERVQRDEQTLRKLWSGFTD